MSLDNFHYKYIDNSATKTLFLLHGTGGSEEDFLFLNDVLGKQYNLVGLRGNVQESGLNRFFRRVASGIFDQQSIVVESEKLQNFISSWTTDHHASLDSLVFLGYSNGANMLLATLFSAPHVFDTLILLHPMLPFEPVVQSDMYAHVRIFISIGAADQMVSPSEAVRVVNVLKAGGAVIEEHTYASGHEINDQELHDVVGFLRQSR